MKTSPRNYLFSYAPVVILALTSLILHFFEIFSSSMIIYTVMPSIILLSFIISLKIGSKEARIKNEIQEYANKLFISMKAGDLSYKPQSSHCSRESGQLLEPITQTVELLMNVCLEMKKVITSIHERKFNYAMASSYEGDFKDFALISNQVTKELLNIFVELKKSIENLQGGSNQVASTSSDLSRGATNQAASLQEISSSMNEIGTQTTMNAKNANEANTLSEQSKKNALQGDAQMKEMVRSMAEINSSSDKISKIIKVIDEIAFQTNLLALNAAVEAARAGKHGKGFAVVAEEVRNLAARSAKAAKETTDMINDSLAKVAHGTSIAKNTELALQEILLSIAKVSGLVGEIATASGEQAQGVSQIVKALDQVSSITQKNSSSSESAAAAAEELQKQAERLYKMVDLVGSDQYEQPTTASFETRSETISYEPSSFIENDSSKEVDSSVNSWEKSSFDNSYQESFVTNSEDCAPSEESMSSFEEPVITAPTVSEGDWGKTPFSNNKGVEQKKEKPKIMLDDTEFGKF